MKYRDYITLIIAFAGLAVPTFAAADHGENFHCDRIPFLNERAVSAIEKLSHNRTMEVIVKEYAQQWEAEEIRRTCEAVAAGDTADFSCLQGRRDWEAIATKIPEELRTLDAAALRPHQLELQKRKAEERPHEQAFQYCEELGVIER